MNIRAERRRISDCFARAALAKLDAAAVARGYEAPVLPSMIPAFVDDFRERAGRVVAHMADETIRKLSDAEDDVLVKVFEDIAADALRKTIS